MSLKDKLNIIISDKSKNRKRKIIVNVLLSIIIFVCFSLTRSITQYAFNDYVEQNDFDYYHIGSITEDKTVEENIDTIKSTPHIIDVFEQNEWSEFVSTIKLDDREFPGDIYLIGKSTEIMNKLSNNKYVDKNSIVCPKIFSADEIETTPFLHRSTLTNMDKYINKTLVVEVNNGNDIKRQYPLRIVETIKNDASGIDQAQCYASRELVLEMHNYSMEGHNNQVIDTKFYMVELDSYKNEDKVRKDLLHKGFDLAATFEFHDDLFKFLANFRYYIIYVVSLFALIFLVKFTMSSIQDKTMEYSIYKTIGLTDTEYKSLINLESIYIIIKSIIYSLLFITFILTIVYILVYNYPFIFIGIKVIPDFLALFIYYPLAILIMYLANMVALKKIKKKSISEYLNRWNYEFNCIYIFYKE